MRRVLDALLPPGSLWSPVEDGGLDLLLDGIAANAEAVRKTLAGLATVRSPAHTTLLPDLEREYGLLVDSQLDDPTRRTRLAATKSGANSNGSAAALQTALRSAGFDLYVHVNDPPVDPRDFAGTLVVNGDTYEHSYYGATTAGDVDAVAGYEGAVCGDQAGFDQRLITYALPADENYWPLVFFVGGVAVRWPGGELLSIDEAVPPAARYGELMSIINKYKPMHSWCVLRVVVDAQNIVQYDDGTNSQFDDNSFIQGAAT